MISIRNNTTLLKENMFLCPRGHPQLNENAGTKLWWASVPMLEQSYIYVTVIRIVNENKRKNNNNEKA